ncbi:F-box only protein 9 [Euwallacea fornicatus]|uniref:F-box only protein 9 n=1 Tax=Euwallacea fornicatus TaxID=995702 RepID=UPI0033906DF6
MDNIPQKAIETNVSPSGAEVENEGELQDKLSSSSNTCQDRIDQSTVEDVLNSFRVKWHEEIQSPKVELSKALSPEESHSENPSKEDIARKYFINGIELEKIGKLFEAIQFYRKAVQLVPDIEYKLDYQSKQLTDDVDAEHLDKSKNYIMSEEDDESSSNSSDDDDNQPIEEGQLLPVILRKVTRAGPLCVSAVEQNFTHISVLPLEVLNYIVKWLVSSDLDLRSLEMFGSVCRGFYVCSRDPEIWKMACLRIWGLACGSTPGSYASWRDMFIDRPRLNFNGCYINKTTYVRYGENSFQDQFYRPWHSITYYRYLRFFSDGTVLMLTSADDPQQCVNQMKLINPRPPIMTGYYRLKDDKVTLVIHRQESPKALQTNFKRGGRRREVDNSDSEQTFHMELSIRNHKNRRNVVLAWSQYSVFTRTKQGQESLCNFDLRTNRFPPLMFSWVKSFTSESEQPLA